MPFDGCLDLRMLWEADLEICCGVVNDSWGRFYENPLRRRQVRSLAKNIKTRQVLIWFAEI
ncbi:hypothetical protein FH972_007578 [Carpinus fangiana]|uniref:Uncharacterized protein n=1 Tax=Carpinus fangiana TaxID=176857 RepID=A0A5N6QYA3_9ROSI|nr:hypothetical protein FH972_007578 [Carpinus fangiana]